jgi:hypothetical protein
MDFLKMIFWPDAVVDTYNTSYSGVRGKGIMVQGQLGKSETIPEKQPKKAQGLRVAQVPPPKKEGPPCLTKFKIYFCAHLMGTKLKQSFTKSFHKDNVCLLS